MPAGPVPHATTRAPQSRQATARPILGVPLKFRGNVPILDLSGFLGNALTGRLPFRHHHAVVYSEEAGQVGKIGPQGIGVRRV